MKRLKFYCLLIVTLLLLRNEIFSQTTEEEYLYTTYGYKEQLLKGLDDKKGYSWKPLSKYIFMSTDKGIPLVGKSGGTMSKFEFEGLFREGGAVPCAIVAIYKATEDMQKRDAVFIPIPHPRSEKNIIAKAEQYFTEEIKLKPKVQTEYVFALGNLAMELAGN